jgi:2,3-bisphosphoglycerate-dependent phosphoglycerate mutase
MRIIAIRHGETEWNAAGREQGQLDSPLTPRGLQQAAAIAERMKRYTFAALYSSDLGRALQTAEIVAKATGSSIAVDTGLRERNTGIFQGMTKEQMAERYASEYAAYSADPYGYEIPGGESGVQRSERSVRVFNALADRHADDTIVVITHGGFLMGFFEHVLSLEPGNSWRFKRQNAAFNAFERRAGIWSLVTWNDTAHLVGLGSLDEPTSL